ncbi:MAG: N-6 DNA methylase [Planctomycetes bacterium]|nr:N-6 DNA methylase [Planctomycetota bacterium]
MPVSKKTITTRNLRSYLGKCGYSDDLLGKDYIYSDAKGCEHKVPIAGFAYPSRDARDACIAAVDRELLEEPAFESVANECRNIGSPVLFICCKKELQWWTLRSSSVELEDTILAEDVSDFFIKHKEEFSPESIYRAKNLSRVHSKYQLTFVDQGLMPVLEHEMGERLADLVKNMLRILDEKLGIPKVDVKLTRWMFQSVFWLLGAKILQDKKVDGFIRLDLEDIPTVLERVSRHYGVKDELVLRTQRQRRALKAAASKIKQFSSLSNVTIESLAHVYETRLINKETRKAWGIHATPSYLVDYIVWQLSDWIEDIPQDDRHVLEPTCGHAPFLTSALRLLREMYQGDVKGLHKYLNNHLVGVERDLFAREIARLSLTLADVPNPNGWKLKECNVFESDALSKLAKKSTILLCNPPFENFSPDEQELYNNEKLNCYNKAAEVLWRTLPYMPTNSVFGVILPQGFLHKDNLSSLREMLLEQFELREICTLPENVFSFAKHKTAVILGRKLKHASKSIKKVKTRYVHVQKWDIEKFQNSYHAPSEEVSQSMFTVQPDYDLRLQLLRDVWEYCECYDCLKEIADIGRGLEYKTVPKEGKEYDIKKHLPPNAKTICLRRFKGSVRGYTEYRTDIKLTETPKPVWMNLDNGVISRPRWGTEVGTPQVIMNSIRAGGGPWRLKGFIDREGHPVTSNFLVVRPKKIELSLEVLWAIVNSPLANAYVYCHSMERNNQTGTMRSIPIPTCDLHSLSKLNYLVKDYFALYASQGEIMQSEVDVEEAKRRMLAIDAEVMRLYDLPPRLEWQILNLFDGDRRKGVDFTFDRYYPEGFESWIPLHIYLSEEYQRSTPSFVKKWVEETRSPELIKALEIAMEAFKE